MTSKGKNKNTLNAEQSTKPIVNRIPSKGLPTDRQGPIFGQKPNFSTQKFRPNLPPSFSNRSLIRKIP